MVITAHDLTTADGRASALADIMRHVQLRYGYSDVEIATVTQSDMNKLVNARKLMRQEKGNTVSYRWRQAIIANWSLGDLD